ncbi:MAG: precorrin-3B synthase [Proteobacteria bacterium]|nr:precorrin-3B synthase [Pseudomonadota bacterium]
MSLPTSNIRGSCPTVAAPMQTGDGLLARIVANEPVSVEKLCSLCDASEAYGNGIVEITQRGSLQIRGLTTASAPRFAGIIEILGLDTGSRPLLLTSPLLGIDAGEAFDSTALLAQLKVAFRPDRPDFQGLGAKVSVLLDGGGSLHLDAVPADIRLEATSNYLFKLSLAGDAASAAFVGYVSMNRVVASLEDLLRLLADRGPGARAKDLVAGLSLSAAPAITRPPCDPIGAYPLKDGTFASGFALSFGHTTAAALKRFAKSAADQGVRGLRPVPGRALLAIGSSLAGAEILRESAAKEGFIVDVTDARRHVIACAGAPACASARLPTRELAPDVARAARPLVGTPHVVHLSGCGKGCAHPGPAAVTIVGPDLVVVNGRAGDAASSTVSSAGLVADIERLCNTIQHG